MIVWLCCAHIVTCSIKIMKKNTQEKYENEWEKERNKKWAVAQLNVMEIENRERRMKAKLRHRTAQWQSSSCDSFIPLFYSFLSEIYTLATVNYPDDQLQAWTRDTICPVDFIRKIERYHTQIARNKCWRQWDRDLEIKRKVKSIDPLWREPME